MALQRSQKQLPAASDRWRLWLAFVAGLALTFATGYGVALMRIPEPPPSPAKILAPERRAHESLPPANCQTDLSASEGPLRCDSQTAESSKAARESARGALNTPGLPVSNTLAESRVSAATDLSHRSGAADGSLPMTDSAESQQGAVSPRFGRDPDPAAGLNPVAPPGSVVAVQSGSSAASARNAAPAPAAAKLNGQSSVRDSATESAATESAGGNQPAVSVGSGAQGGNESDGGDPSATPDNSAKNPYDELRNQLANDPLYQDEELLREEQAHRFQAYLDAVAAEEQRQHGTKGGS